MPAGITDEGLSESSTDDVKVLDVADAPTTIADSDTAATTADADSSAAKGEEPDLLSVVRDVVDKARSPDSPSDEPEVAASKAVDKEAKSEQDDYADVPFNKHPRFKQLLTERNTFKVDAERYTNIQTFLRETGVSDAEASNALEVSALAKHNPAAAWERLRPWVQDLLVRAGEVLPEELQQRVEQGEMSREAAIELSKARATTTSMQERQQFERQLQEQRQAEQVRGAIQTTVEDWQTRRQKADPDFERKLPYIQKEIAWRHRQGDKPETSEGVREQLEAVYKDVNAQLRSIVAPARVKPAIKPVMGGQAVPEARAKPKSILDVVEQTVDQMRESA